MGTLGNLRRLTLLAACCLASCRTTRDKVEVLNTEKRPDFGDSSDTSSLAGMKSSLLIDDVTLPVGIVNFSKLVVTVIPVTSGQDGNGKCIPNYVLGTPIAILALKEYRVEVKAFADGDILLAENANCTKKAKIQRSKVGQNRITVSLCLGPANSEATADCLSSR